MRRFAGIRRHCVFVEEHIYYALMDFCRSKIVKDLSEYCVQFGRMIKYCQRWIRDCVLHGREAVMEGGKLRTEVIQETGIRAQVIQKLREAIEWEGFCRGAHRFAQIGAENGLCGGNDSG